MTKINNIESLNAEKKTLQRLIQESENQLEHRIDYLRENYVELSVDHIFIPAFKRAFKLENILRFFNLSSFSNVFTDGDKNKNIISELSGMFGKTGWLVALKLAVSIFKKMFK